MEDIATHRQCLCIDLNHPGNLGCKGQHTLSHTSSVNRYQLLNSSMVHWLSRSRFQWLYGSTRRKIYAYFNEQIYNKDGCRKKRLWLQKEKEKGKDLHGGMPKDGHSVLSQCALPIATRPLLFSTQISAWV